MPVLRPVSAPRRTTLTPNKPEEIKEEKDKNLDLLDVLDVQLRPVSASTQASLSVSPVRQSTVKVLSTPKKTEPKKEPVQTKKVPVKAKISVA